MPSSRTSRSLTLSSGVMRMRQSTGLKEGSPGKKSKEKRKFLSKNACSPLPKKGELPACAALTLLGESTRRPSKNVSEDAVRFKNVCWPRRSTQMGWSPLRRLRLNGSYQRDLVYMYSPFCE